MSSEDSNKKPVNTHGANIIAHLKVLEENWPSHCEVLAYQSRCVRQKYMAALDEGFTETQALQLSTTPWN